MKLCRGEILLNELAQKYKEDGRFPFPHADCQLIVSSNSKKYEDFVAHLDLYFLSIAGLCSRGKNLLQLPESEIELIKKQILLSFFEKYPQYIELKNLISKKYTPDLYSNLNIYESLRKLLIKLLNLDKKEERCEIAPQTV